MRFSEIIDLNPLHILGGQSSGFGDIGDMLSKLNNKDDTKSSIGLKPDSSGGIGLKPSSSSGIGLKMPVDAKIGQQFKGSQHPGVDIPVPVGTPVRSPVDGVVEIATSHPDAGNYVNIKTADGGKQRFLHLSKFNVKQGDKVKAGDVIGLSGSTGKSTGPHLHWEKWAGNSYSSAVNPVAENKK